MSDRCCIFHKDNRIINKKLLSSIIALVFLCTYPGTSQITAENDTLFCKQKKLFEKLDVFKAWEITKGSPDVVIGCIDMGFDFFHPYLYNRIIPGYYEDNVFHSLTFETTAHGTMMAGLIIANPCQRNNDYIGWCE